MKVVNLGENPSVLNNFIAEMRDATIQKDRSKPHESRQSR